MPLNFGTLFDREGNILKTEAFRIDSKQIKEDTGPPTDEYPEGTLIANTAENRLYVRVKGATQQPDGVYFKLNETSGTTATDSGSGSHNGTASDGSKWTTGKYDNGYNTDAAYISVASHSDFDFGDMTIMMWIKASEWDNDIMLYSRAHDNNMGNDWIGLQIATPLIGFTVNEDGVASDTISVTITDYMSLNNWHHIAAVIDTGASKIRLYIDGNLVAESAYTANPSDIAGDTIWIGAYPDTTGKFSGVIDEVKVFKSVRTQSQIVKDALQKQELVWSYATLTGA